MMSLIAPASHEANRLPQRGEAEIASEEREQFRVGGVFPLAASPHPTCFARKRASQADLPALGEVISIGDFPDPRAREMGGEQA